MDVFAHGAISHLAFGRDKKARYSLLAILLGILPDLFSWTIYTFHRLLTGGLPVGKPHLEDIPDWVFTLYGISHSVFVFGIVLWLVYLWKNNIPVYLWAWGLHILIDIPTHSREYLPTPFLWPISNWHFPGISWGTGWFFAGYWILIIVCFIYLVIMKGPKKS